MYFGRVSTKAFYRTFLKAELARRADRNPRYSLRSYAKALGINPGVLSLILSGKRIPSVRQMERLMTRLPLEPEQRAEFVASIARTQQKRGLQRLSPVFRQAPAHGDGAARELTLDLFRVISDWYHYAILELTFVPGFDGSPGKVARALGISELGAKLAIERLEELELLERDGLGRLRKSSARITTPDKNLSAPALRKRQRQILEKSIDSLENDPIESRSHTAMTMAVAPEKLSEARQKILNFQRELCAFLESGTQERVYELQISLFPLQKGELK